MASAKKNKEINHTNLVEVKPITDNQKVVFDTYNKGKNQFLFGAAGTAAVASISTARSSNAGRLSARLLSHGFLNPHAGEL